MNRSAIRILATALLMILLTGLMPGALASSSFEAVVTSGTMKVYREKSPHDQIGSLPKGTVVTVKDYNGKAALITYKGYTGIAPIDDLKRVTESSDDSSSEKAEEKAEKASSDELSNAKPVITTKKAKVYKKASMKSDYVRVNAGVKLNLLAVSGDTAKVEKNGVVGYMDVDYLKSAESSAEKSTSAGFDSDDGEITKYDDKSVMTSESCHIYASPSSSAKKVSVKAGVVLQLVATQGDWAMVKKGSAVGYVDRDHLTTEIKTAEISTADVKSSSSSSGIFTGSNEQIIFKFLVQEMGYNTAAACGVLANVKYESDYKATCSGDHGTSYGIVQWHADRKARMISWCESHGYEADTLKGQLYFLKYELKTYYPAVHSKLKNVSNTAQGAYDAGYEFCYNFEAPASRASQSASRANYARDTLFSRYKA